ncbi:hypothetical protein [Ruegeria lacuscaerulensis]|uniref:hypothetical protein n=1 Tax=Ruegeria lacuscaerulensis TaxID=55218 RepID=UPI00147A3BA2|nr:hypothetical protein [Ruegeria lacuscaerulensis]
MIRVAVLISSLIAAATGAAAREVTVRSGEHDGYTRLVVQVPPDTGWVLKQSKNGAQLNVALDNVTFQTGSVFQRLTENRLATISQPKPGAALQMEFGCDCVASAFLFRKTMIVVDIAPGRFPPPLTSDIPSPAQPKASLDVTPVTSARTLDLPALPLLTLNAEGFEDQLAMRLLQGADRGIVDLNIAPVGPRASTANQSLLVPSGMEMNISVTSVLDDLNGLLGPDIPQLEKKPPCISSAELGFDSWTDKRPFPEQTAELRSGLYREFDVIDKANVLKLAKLYTYFGFGTEALKALELLGEHSAETDRISTIARVLDDSNLSGPNPFAGLQRCKSDAALWAALTEGRLQGGADLAAIEQTFARLPVHLRRHVGPPLSDILVEAQEVEAARRVLRSVARVETQPSPSVEQAKAKVATAEGDAAQTEALLKDVITASDAALEAPMALARLVEKRWLERGAVSPQDIDLAESYTVEFRRSEIGPLMQRTHAVALSLGHEFDPALDLLADMPEDAESVETLNRVVLILAERADDATFLRRVLSLSKTHYQGLTTDTAITVADRLASLGFSKPALTLAKRPQDTIRRNERARIRARAALLDKRPHQAMLELADDSSDEAVLLRAEAMRATGEFAVAGDLLRTSGHLDEVNRLFWLSDRLNEVNTEVGAKFGQIIQATQDLSEPPSRLPEKPLADAANLLQDSQETRQKIAELLAALEQE